MDEIDLVYHLQKATGLITYILQAEEIVKKATTTTNPVVYIVFNEVLYS